jgi:hypothetical protein
MGHIRTSAGSFFIEPVPDAHLHGETKMTTTKQVMNDSENVPSDVTPSSSGGGSSIPHIVTRFPGSLDISKFAFKGRPRQPSEGAGGHEEPDSLTVKTRRRRSVGKTPPDADASSGKDDWCGLSG